MGLDFLSTADMLGKIFYCFAVFGTIFFILRTIMMFAGGDVDGDMDGDIDMDTDSDAAFQLISLNSITAFFMMFGWTGLTCYVQFGLSALLSVFIAFAVGVMSMFFVAWLFKMAMKLVSKGAEFKMADTVGLTGSVYQQIPADGRGKVNVTMTNGMLRELEAVSEDKVQIDSFKTIKVVKVVDSRTISVRLA